MSQIRIFHLILLILLLGGWSSSLLAQSESQKKDLIVCMEDGNFPPHNFAAPNQNNRQGIVIELIQRSAQEADLNAVFVHKPWRRCLYDLKYNRVDAVAPMRWTNEREQWARFPRHENHTLKREARLWTVKYEVFVKRDSDLVWDGKQFSGVRHGVASPLGHVSHDKLKQLGVLPSASFTLQEGISLLARNLLDGFVFESLVGHEQVKKLGHAHHVETLPVSFIETDWYLVFSDGFVRRHTISASRVWEAFATHQHDWHNELLNKYVSN